MVSQGATGQDPTSNSNQDSTSNSNQAGSPPFLPLQRPLAAPTSTTVLKDNDASILTSNSEQDSEMNSTSLSGDPSSTASPSKGPAGEVARKMKKLFNSSPNCAQNASEDFEEPYSFSLYCSDEVKLSLVMESSSSLAKQLQTQTEQENHQDCCQNSLNAILKHRASWPANMANELKEFSPQFKIFFGSNWTHSSGYFHINSISWEKFLDQHALEHLKDHLKCEKKERCY